MKNLKYVLFITIILFSSFNSYSAEEEKFSIKSLKLHIKISDMKESELPFISGENLVFSYKPSRKNPRHVGIAFENENFSKIHNLYRNENGIYFYIYKYPKKTTVNYRFIEDGVWLADKKNSNTTTDNNFITLSSFTIPEDNIKEHLSPIISGKKATFKITGNENSSVYLTGDFNNWNPFLYPLNEVEPGIYSITIDLPKGQYGYYFIFNGERLLDRENFKRGISRLGENVSLFTIP